MHQDNDPLLYWRNDEPTNLKCTINMNLLCRCTNTIHPPPAHFLPPEDEQPKCPFSQKYWKSRKCIYLHSLSHCRPNGCQFSVSPPPTYSMGSVHKTACAGYSTLIITGNTGSKTQIKTNSFSFCSKLHFICMFYFQAIMEMSWSTARLTSGYSSVKIKLLWTELKAHLSHQLMRGKKRNLACYSRSMQTISKCFLWAGWIHLWTTVIFVCCHFRAIFTSNSIAMARKMMLGEMLPPSGSCEVLHAVSTVAVFSTVLMTELLHSIYRINRNNNSQNS